MEAGVVATGSSNATRAAACVVSSGSGCPIPKRGQVKLGIVFGIAHSVSSIFSSSSSSSSSTTTRHRSTSVPH